MRLLAIDIENRETSIGLFHGADLASVWTLGTAGRTSHEYFLSLRDLLGETGSPDAVVVASVVPSSLAAMRGAIELLVGEPPLVIGPGVKTGIEMQVDHPREVGADRVVNAVAARSLYGDPVIVIDLGAATTIDAVGTGGRIPGRSYRTRPRGVAGWHGECHRHSAES